jgi:hypothetical protein
MAAVRGAALRHLPEVPTGKKAKSKGLHGYRPLLLINE